MHRGAVVLGVSLGLVLPGCGLFRGESGDEGSPPMAGEGSGGQEDPPPSDSGGSPEEPQPVDDHDIGPCAVGFTSLEVEETVEIVDDLRIGLGALIVAGQSEQGLVGHAVNGMHEALMFDGPDPAPEGWGFEGDGTYRWASDELEVESVFRFGADYAFATADERPAEDVLDPRTYLVGATLDLGDGFPGPTATLSFDETGPYVELLGLGTDPRGPLTLDGEGVMAIREEGLMDLVLVSDIRVQIDIFDRTSIRYRATTPPNTTREIMPLEDPKPDRAIDLVDAEILDLNLGRELRIDDWDLRFVNALLGPWLDGEITFHIDGGHFPIRGSIRYQGGAIGQVSIECG